MKRYKTILSKIEERQKQLPGNTKENPFEKFQFKDIVKTASGMQDKAKIERLFQKAEIKLEEFFEQKKNYYKNINRSQQFRTDAVVQQERQRDREGDMSVRV